MRIKKKLVLEKIEECREEAIHLLQDLIKINSCNPPGDEKEIANCTADYVRQMGMEVEQIEPFPRRVSNLARLRGKKGKPVLLFCSHLDTRPPGNLANWKYPPFAAEIHEGHVWGCGAVNMKQGLAAAMFAVKALKLCGLQLEGDLLLAQCADEFAFGFKGLGQMVARGLIQADFALYTESNVPPKVEIGHLGCLMLDIRVTGYASHTTRREKGIDAILKMTKLVQALASMQFSNWQPHDIVPGNPVISVNRIIGGFSDTLCADECTVRCDCRYLPSQTAATVLNDVERVLNILRKNDPEFNVQMETVLEAPPSWISPNELIVKATQQAIREVTGKDLPAGGVRATSDTRWLVLNAGIPTCMFSFKTVDSGTNERVSVEDYLNTIKVYAALAVNLLGVDQTC